MATNNAVVLTPIKRITDKGKTGYRLVDNYGSEYVLPNSEIKNILKSGSFNGTPVIIHYLSLDSTNRVIFSSSKNENELDFFDVIAGGMLYNNNLDECCLIELSTPFMERQSRIVVRLSENLTKETACEARDILCRNACITDTELLLTKKNNNGICPVYFKFEFDINTSVLNVCVKSLVESIYSKREEYIYKWTLNFEELSAGNKTYSGVTDKLALLLRQSNYRVGKELNEEELSRVEELLLKAKQAPKRVYIQVPKQALKQAAKQAPSINEVPKNVKKYNIEKVDDCKAVVHNPYFESVVIERLSKHSENFRIHIKDSSLNINHMFELHNGQGAGRAGKLFDRFTSNLTNEEPSAETLIEIIEFLDRCTDLTEMFNVRGSNLTKRKQIFELISNKLGKLAEYQAQIERNAESRCEALLTFGIRPEYVDKYAGALGRSENSNEQMAWCICKIRALVGQNRIDNKATAELAFYCGITLWYNYNVRLQNGPFGFGSRASSSTSLYAWDKNSEVDIIFNNRNKYLNSVAQDIRSYLRIAPMRYLKEHTTQKQTTQNKSNSTLGSMFGLFKR